MEIRSIRFENIRGFLNAEMNITNQRYVFVGSNNSGKTSILIILDWFFNILEFERKDVVSDIPPEWNSILLPARETRNQARRITLIVDISDGRKARPYQDARHDDGVGYVLRINFRLNPARFVVRLGKPTRSEDFAHDPKAVTLVKELQSSIVYHYISSFRGHSGKEISKLFKEMYANHLRTWFDSLHHKNRERNRIEKLREGIKNLSDKELRSPTEEVFQVLPAALRPKYSLDSEIPIKELIEFVAHNSAIRLSTGEHDKSYVAPDKVGAGLRSALELAIRTNRNSGKESWVAIDEPEAYLHPAAQRLLARKLFSLQVNKSFISTHSPIMVEESDLSSVVITSDQQFYPARVKGEKNREIGLALLKKHGAELVFNTCILLVEGESDYFFFEIIRERLLEVDESGELSRLYVLPVGGKQQFCPYAELIDCFGEGQGPIHWTILADGDATSELEFLDSELELGFDSSVRAKIRETDSYFMNAEIENWITSIKELNSLLKGVFLAPADLEYMVLERISKHNLMNLAEFINMNPDSEKEVVLKKLGSKSVNQGRVINDPKKGPYIRAYIARNLKPNEFSASLVGLLLKWVSPIGMNERKLRSLINKLS